jgi:hypothetical protein
VLGGIRFGQLHTDLRYPSFSERQQSYAMLRITQHDAEIAMQRLQTLYSAISVPSSVYKTSKIPTM